MDYRSELADLRGGRDMESGGLPRSSQGVEHLTLLSPTYQSSGVTHSLSLALCGLWVSIHPAMINPMDVIHCIGILALERF